MGFFQVQFLNMIFPQVRFPNMGSPRVQFLNMIFPQV